MEALYHQHMNYVAAKAAEQTLTLALRWMNEAPSSDLFYTVALLQRTVTRIERIIAFAESLSSVEDNSEQRKKWHEIRMVVRLIRERLVHHQQNSCGTTLSSTDNGCFSPLLE